MRADLRPDGEVGEDELLRRYASGDLHAAADLARILLPVALRYARRMMNDPNEAEDVAQDAMMRMWRVAPDWQPGQAKLSTWLYRVTANLCIDRSRRKKTAPLQNVREPVDPADSVTDAMQAKSRNDALQVALSELPDRQRQAVVLRHIEGLPNPEIADIMGISARAVESLTARGKAALADKLAHKRPELGFEDD